ncbi:3-deoxy-D-manno-octulosonic acid transferase [Niabella ginsenosidivorans]|uniref:3-deoxy-D-manno-octulosonic acid transferase n=1 Tax=Niabella ginsenosidivorans TaxID=1176587 RepID=A0A1A9IB25_9BACT|nr:glycosyltransferase N-terminal domain-containing protein [Niabella ginsenosidivorans]ANH83881.1 3-deoxy-D-manno-octulosonic acid transferase [Niabella ginsenosidivorans]
MSVVIYTIFLYLYRWGISVASVFNKKARLWISGRKRLAEWLHQSFGNNNSPVIWMHCASLGEFEQGRPVLEALKQQYPGHKILLTFFSPSGYEIRKNYNQADWVGYLPLDTPANVKQFLDQVRPELALFVKYEYWYHFLHQLNRRNIPTLLISALFRENSIFLKSYGGFHRKMLGFFTHIFVQDAASKERLAHIVPDIKVTAAGDTRFDRVVQIADQFTPIPVIERFAKDKPFIIVAGSTWPEDEHLLSQYINKNKRNTSLIIAPHEINKEHIDEIIKYFPDAVLYSVTEQDADAALNSNILIIDNIGMLSRLYYYASVAYIGGGFNKSGIHNTLEAAVFSRPVIFGPNYRKFYEAISLIKKEGAFSYSTGNELEDEIRKLKNNPAFLEICGKNAGDFVRAGTGATAIILSYIEANLR